MIHDHNVHPSLPTSVSAPAFALPEAGAERRTADGALRVEPVRWRDLRAVGRVQRRAFRPALAYGLPTLLALWLLPHARFFVARREGEVVGCVIGDRQGENARVISLAVDPAARRRGVGTALLRALETALPQGNMLLMVEEGTIDRSALRSGLG